MDESIGWFEAVYGVLGIGALALELLLIWWIFQSLRDIRSELRSLRTDLSVRQEKNGVQNSARCLRDPERTPPDLGD